MDENDEANERHLKVTVHLTEFEKLKDEIHQSEINLQQTLVIVGGSFSLVAPLLLDNLDRFSPNTMKLTLYTLVILYSCMTANYCWSLYAIFTLGKYINEHLVKEVNYLLRTEEGHKLLNWEKFVRNERRKLPVFIVSGGQGASVILALIPSFLSIMVAENINSFKSMFSRQDIAVTGAIMPYVAVFSWIFFISSLVITVAALFITLTNGLSISKIKTIKHKRKGISNSKT